MPERLEYMLLQQVAAVSAGMVLPLHVGGKPLRLRVVSCQPVGTPVKLWVGMDLHVIPRPESSAVASADGLRAPGDRGTQDAPPGSSNVDPLSNGQSPSWTRRKNLASLMRVCTAAVSHETVHGADGHEPKRGAHSMEAVASGIAWVGRAGGSLHAGAEGGQEGGRTPGVLRLSGRGGRTAVVACLTAQSEDGHGGAVPSGHVGVHPLLQQYLHVGVCEVAGAVASKMAVREAADLGGGSGLTGRGSHEAQTGTSTGQAPGQSVRAKGGAGRGDSEGWAGAGGDGAAVRVELQGELLCESASHARDYMGLVMEHVEGGLERMVADWVATQQK